MSCNETFCFRLETQRQPEQRKQKEKKSAVIDKNTQNPKTEGITSPCLILLLQHLESRRVFWLHPLCLVDSSPWTCVSFCLCESTCACEALFQASYWNGKEWRKSLVLKKQATRGGRRRERERESRGATGEWKSFCYFCRLLRYRRGGLICLQVWEQPSADSSAPLPFCCLFT